MTFIEFINTYNNKKVDYDGVSGYQCVDLAKVYMNKVLGIKPYAIGNAEAYWNKFELVTFLNKKIGRASCRERVCA